MTSEANSITNIPSDIPQESPDQERVLTAEEVANRLGVAATNTKATPRQRKRAFWWFRQLLTISQLLDPIQTPNSFVNYQCVWWKAISGNDATSPLRDGGFAYDLLPPFTRWAVAPPLATLYPRFHHGNVELRTKYLDTAMGKIMESLPHNVNNIRLVLMGGGYDLRSLRMAMRYQDDYTMDLVELDLPQVIDAKQTIFQKRLLRRRPQLKDLIHQIRMFGADFNDVDQLSDVLTNHVLSDNGKGSKSWHTIFVFEAVLIYLDKGVPSKVLNVLSQALRQHGQSGALCFADTLSNVEASLEGEAREELVRNGWDLQDWITKPGRTKHLGLAALHPGVN